jgi:hypothetical protein
MEKSLYLVTILEKEYQILRPLLIKYKNQHKSTKYYQKLLEIVRLFKKFMIVKVSKPSVAMALLMKTNDCIESIFRLLVDQIKMTFFMNISVVWISLISKIHRVNKMLIEIERKMCDEACPVIEILESDKVIHEEEVKCKEWVDSLETKTVTELLNSHTMEEQDEIDLIFNF